MTWAGRRCREWWRSGRSACCLRCIADFHQGSIVSPGQPYSTCHYCPRTMIGCHRTQDYSLPAAVACSSSGLLQVCRRGTTHRRLCWRTWVPTSAELPLMQATCRGRLSQMSYTIKGASFCPSVCAHGGEEFQERKKERSVYVINGTRILVEEDKNRE